MADAIIDIVIPVWNRPNETRNCLVNLINNTPNARFVMFDSGSDRETEKLLQDFADGLDDRALLMREDSNIGFVRAVNRGLERSDAPYLALVRNTTQVSFGWLEPLLAFASAHPEAGILLPCVTTEQARYLGPIEVADASFSAMVITRRLFDQIGGFDEGLDGGLWCLRDYARRACAKGFFTHRVPGPVVAYQPEVLLGSERRREENLQRTLSVFRGRWGEGRSYLIHVPKDVELDLLGQKLELLRQGARHGDSYAILLSAALYKAARQAGFRLLHEHIRLVALPRFAGNAGRRRVFERIMAETPGTVPVAAIDGIAFPWSDACLTFTELCEQIRLAGP